MPGTKGAPCVCLQQHRWQQKCKSGGNGGKLPIHQRVNNFHSVPTASQALVVNKIILPSRTHISPHIHQIFCAFIQLTDIHLLCTYYKQDYALENLHIHMHAHTHTHTHTNLCSQGTHNYFFYSLINLTCIDQALFLSQAWYQAI